MCLGTCLLGPRTGITNVRDLLTATPLLINENFTGNSVRKAIRGVQKHEFTPIIILGGMSYTSSLSTQIDLLYCLGHSHIRNCGMSILWVSSEKLFTSYYLEQTFPGEKVADEYTMALQSGRFMETVGASYPPCHIPRELSPLDYCRLA